MLVWDLVLFPQRQTRSVCLIFSNQRFVNSCLANKCLYKHSYTYLRAINLSFNCNVYDPLLLHILRFQKFITMFSFLSFFFLASGNYRILNETDRKNDYHCPQMRWPLAKGLVQVYGCGRYKNVSPSRPYITLWDGPPPLFPFLPIPYPLPLSTPATQARTVATGWLSGSHPTVNQGAVRRRVCFHWAGRDRRRRKYDRPCMWSRYIRVLNCTTFLVYELIPIKDDTCVCYCGASWS